MKINLFNRDGADLWLEPKTWTLKVDDSHKYALDFMRLIGDEEIEAVDPSGGPFISVGDILGEYKVTKIINPTTFEMEYYGNNK